MDIKMNSVFDDAVEVEKSFDVMFGAEEDDDLIGIVLGEEADDFDTLDDGTTAEDIRKDFDTESKNQPTADSDGEFDIKDDNLGNLGCPKFGVADAVEKKAPEEDDLDTEIDKSIDKIYESILGEECDDCDGVDIEPAVPDGNADTAFVDTDSDVDDEDDELEIEAALEALLREETETDTASDAEDESEKSQDTNNTNIEESDDIDAAIAGEVPDDAGVDEEPVAPEGDGVEYSPKAVEEEEIEVDIEDDDEEVDIEAALEALMLEEDEEKSEDKEEKSEDKEEKSDDEDDDVDAAIAGEEPEEKESEDKEEKQEERCKENASVTDWLDSLLEGSEETVEDEIIDTVQDDGELSDAEVKELIDSDDEDILDDVLGEDD